MNASRPTAVLVAGSANLDFVVRASHVPAPGETVLGRDFATFPGGKGANQAVACARAGGADTRFVAAFGDDDVGNPILASLAAARVATTIVRIDGAPSGSAFVCVSDDGENAITVAPGANLHLAASHLPSLDGTGHLLMQLETPLATVQAFASAARAAGVVVILNAAPAQSLSAALLDCIDILVVNEGELATLAGAAGSIADRMTRLPVATVVTTLGARGACAKTRGGWRLQPAWAVDVVDTTAAGDTFCGVFVAALARGASIEVALRDASAAAALACTRVGAQTSVPSRAEVDALVATTPSGSSGTLASWCGIGTDER